MGAAGNNNAVLAGILYKTMPTWSFLAVNDYGPGKVFTECEQLIIKGLEKVGFDPVLLEETKNWKTGGKKFNLRKEQVICLPTSVRELRLGLGWDTRCDLDSSILLLDKHGNLVDNIYYAKRFNESRSVVHSGDNRTGIGSGDDETITIRLDSLPKGIDSIWPVITIYTAGN